MSVVVQRQGFPLPLGVSPEAEVFAVGDIHGRSDLLAALIDEAAREPRLREKRAIVFLGDVVDRGPDSLGAIDLGIRSLERAQVDAGAIALRSDGHAQATARGNVLRPRNGTRRIERELTNRPLFS